MIESKTTGGYFFFAHRAKSTPEINKNSVHIVLLLSRPTSPTCAFHPTRASSYSSVCTTSHDDTSAFSLCDGKLVVLCITDLSVGQANISNDEQLSFKIIL